MVVEVPRDSVVSSGCLCWQRKHPSASGSGQGPQPAGELRELSCLRANNSLMLFMVMNSRGVDEEKEEEEGKEGQEVRRKLEGQEERSKQKGRQIRRRDDQKGQTEKKTNTETPWLWQDMVTLLLSITGRKYMTIKSLSRGKRRVEKKERMKKGRMKQTADGN